ncbi:hypothetical protein [Desulfosudis oleivorans]|uniref:AP2 domain-containing protein n=1 Tax=Desulfosudis oleivorans (strain DSM 6200 / JCM 39069 / Hxd3) TaxID=96561 RepID=A8ZS12_DESOH|nr:hypothetical protein [Desulfosudis oleivorans]ABW66030.1 hypothetical protein Dole_0220 [Desulfosudis oleivorans Hxd3]
MVDVKLSKERNKKGEIISATVSIDRNGAIERRRFATEEEAKAFIRRMREEAARDQ